MNRQLWLVSLTFFLAMFGYNLGQSFLSVYASPFLSMWEISLVVAAVYAAFALSSLFAGKLIEKHGTVKSIRLGALLYVPFLLFLWSSKSFWLLVLGAALVGLGAGFLWVAGPTFVLHNTDKRGRHLGMFHSASELGSSFAGLAGGILASFFPLQSIFFIGAALLVSSALPSFLMSDKNVVKRDYTWRMQLGMLFDRNLFALGLIGLVTSLLFGLIIPLLPAVIKSLGGGAFEVGMAFFAYGVFTMVSMMASGIKSDEVGRKRILLFALLLGAASAAALFLAQDYFVILAAVAAYSLVRSTSNVLTGAALGDLFKEKLALARSVTSFYSIVGVVLGSLSAGVLGSADSRLPFLVMAVVMLLSVALLKWVDVK